MNKLKDFFIFLTKKGFVLILICCALYLLSDWKEIADAIKKMDFKSLHLDLYLKAFIFFLVMLQVVRALTHLLKNKLFKKAQLDKGTAYAIVRTVKYLGWIVTGWGTMAILGIDMKNLAIVFGALSVGIGFGLQNIVNNFVSGLLILIERPIKIGDWIVVKGQEGIVKSINIRSTELITFDETSVLIPNADIISNDLANLTRDNSLGRLIVQIKVPFDTDLKKVEKILTKCLASQKGLNKDKKPSVILTEFSDNGAFFEMRLVVENVMERLAIRSQLMFSIWEEFQKNKIEIPFPQRIVHIKKE